MCEVPESSSPYCPCPSVFVLHDLTITASHEIEIQAMQPTHHAHFNYDPLDISSQDQGEREAVQHRRKLQLKADSGVLMSSPKQGLSGQYFQLKTLNSYSKCTKVPVSPRNPKSEDELVVVHARPMKPSEVLDMMMKKQNAAKAQLQRQITQGLKKQAPVSEHDRGDGGSLGANNKTKLKPIRRGKSRRQIDGDSGLPASPIDKSKYRSSRHISPLKRKTGLQNLTYTEARLKYKEQFPTSHPPEVVLQRRSKHAHKKQRQV